MDWINSVSNMDNTIYDICIKDSCLIIYIKTWDQKIRQEQQKDFFEKLGKLFFQTIMPSKKKIL